MKSLKEKAASVRNAVETAEERRKKPIPNESWLSLGNTVLNLAVSGEKDRGIAKGMYLYVIGDSSSGKTFVCMTALAEAVQNANFDGHELIYDDVEQGNLFDVEKFFGIGLADRIRPPTGTRDDPKNSETVQEFYYNLHRALKAGPCIYVLDSMDSLLAKEDEEKFQEEIDAADKGKELTGSYGMAKAKSNSNNIKRAVSMLGRSGSILIIVSQTRDKIGGYGGKTRAGGRALKFYSHLEVWFSVKQDLRKTILGKDREYGKLVVADVQKNRVNGREGKVLIPFLWDYGLDDTGACVSYLIEEKHWKENKGIVEAPEFDFKGRKEQLIEKLESVRGGIAKLRMLTEKCWKRIADATAVRRIRKYD